MNKEVISKHNHELLRSLTAELRGTSCEVCKTQWPFLSYHYQVFFKSHQRTDQTVDKSSSLKMTIYTQSLLTIAGISQHLSRLVQPKLQTISNIWSWNCGREKWEHKRMLQMARIERWGFKKKKKHAHNSVLKRNTERIESVQA